MRKPTYEVLCGDEPVATRSVCRTESRRVAEESRSKLNAQGRKAMLIDRRHAPH
jgi:hypothetical protein